MFHLNVGLGYWIGFNPLIDSRLWHYIVFLKLVIELKWIELMNWIELMKWNEWVMNNPTAVDGMECFGAPRWCQWSLIKTPVNLTHLISHLVKCNHWNNWINPSIKARSWMVHPSTLCQWEHWYWMLPLRRTEWMNTNIIVNSCKCYWFELSRIIDYRLDRQVICMYYHKLVYTLLNRHVHNVIDDIIGQVAHAGNPEAAPPTEEANQVPLGGLIEWTWIGVRRNNE